jgi:hypothetical protein
MRLALSEGTSPEDGSRASFRNIIFLTNLKFPTMNKIHKSSDFKGELVSQVYFCRLE